MYTQVEKPKENKSSALPNSVGQKKSNVKQGFGFIDNRPEAVTQLRIQSIIQRHSESQSAQMKTKYFSQQVTSQEQNSSNIIQCAPVPLVDQETERGSKYIDTDLDIVLTKLNDNNGYLYLESHILYWNGHEYLNQNNEVVVPTDLEDTGEKTLDITQGELAYINHDNNPNEYTHIRTSNASPCIILIIHDTLNNKSLMAHIHRGNTDDQIRQMMNSITDRATNTIKLITRAYDGDSEKELEIQETRMGYLHAHFNTMNHINYTRTIDQENATLDIATGEVEHHDDGAGSDDIGLMGITRALVKEKEFTRTGDDSVLFDVRTSNVSDVFDDEYEHIEAGKGTMDTMESVMGDVQLKKITTTPVAQLIPVYNGPTRQGNGFDEDEMYAEFSKSPEALELEDQIGDMGFTYVGDTGSQSKANTDFGKREIRINSGLTAEVAALSFVYELKNASQNDDFKEIFKLPFADTGSKDRAEEYASRIMRLEAKSVLMRSLMAVAMDKEDLVRNQRYNAIAKATGSHHAKEEAIFKEMKKNATVHQGAKKAFDHYVDLFWSENDKSIYGLD